MKAAFARIDPILDAWAKKFGLHVYRKHQEEVVRVVHVVDDKGLVYHIGVENVDDSYVIRCYWSTGKKVDRKRVTKSWEHVSSTEELARDLKEAYAITERWIAENGNTRKWMER